MRAKGLEDFYNTIEALHNFEEKLYTELGTLNKRAAEDLVKWLQDALLSQKYFGGRQITDSTRKRKIRAGTQVELLGFATTVMYHSLTIIKTSGGSKKSAGFEVGWPHNLHNAIYQGRNSRSKNGRQWVTRVEDYAAIFEDRFPWFNPGCEEWAEKKFPAYVDDIADRMVYRFAEERK